MLQDGRPYRCGRCGGWFEWRAVGISCLVLHGPGECCHQYEKRAEPPDNWLRDDEYPRTPVAGAVR